MSLPPAPPLLPTAPPDIEELVGRAWQLNRPEMMKYPTVLAEWLVHAPKATPPIHSFQFVLYHLRPTEGIQDAMKFDEECTHELVVHALDHRHPLSLDGRQNIVVPHNIEGQFYARTDARADLYVRGIIKLVCKGVLSPDTDARAGWADKLHLAPPSETRHCDTTIDAVKNEQQT